MSNSSSERDLRRFRIKVIPTLGVMIKMDYTKCSDEKLSRLVYERNSDYIASTLKGGLKDLFIQELTRKLDKGAFNFSINSWADMGPIITANKIDLRWNQTNEDLCQAGTLSGRNYSPYSRHANPLRAAAIVYLMIGEEK